MRDGLTVLFVVRQRLIFFTFVEKKHSALTFHPEFNQVWMCDSFEMAVQKLSFTIPTLE